MRQINESNKSNKPKFIWLVLEPKGTESAQEKPIARSRDPRQSKEWVGIQDPKYVQKDFLLEEGVVLTRLPQDYLGDRLAAEMEEQSRYTQKK